jgi:hypothetical protein
LQKGKDATGQVEKYLGDTPPLCGLSFIIDPGLRDIFHNGDDQLHVGESVNLESGVRFDKNLLYVFSNPQTTYHVDPCPGGWVISSVRALSQNNANYYTYRCNGAPEEAKNRFTNGLEAGDFETPDLRPKLGVN